MSAKTISAAEFKAKCLRIITELQGTGQSVTITRRGRPVAVLSCPSPEELPGPLFGAMRGTVLAYDDPFAPAASPSDWSSSS